MFGTKAPQKSEVPKHSVGGAAVLERDDVSYFMANVHIHFIGHTQGEIHCALPADLSAHHHAVPVLHRQAELCTPLWDLQQGHGHTSSHIISAYWQTFFSSHEYAFALIY